MINQALLEKLKTITPEEQKIIDGKFDIDRDIYMESEENIVSTKKVLKEGKLIDIRPHTRFVHFPLHSHDFVEIIYMCSGTTTHIIDGKEIVLKQGELLFLCQSAKQEILPAGENDIAVNFIIRPEFFNKGLQMISDEDTPLRKFIIESLTNKNVSISHLHFQVADILPVQNLLENLIWTLINGTTNKRNINQITMGLLFLQLINHTDRLKAPDKNEETIVKVLKYIEENYQNGSLEALCGQLFYDLSALSREIKAKTGKTFTTLLIEKRLSQACFLLKNTNMNIEEIACNTGYKNISFFYRIFKQHYGVSPKNYRNKIL